MLNNAVYANARRSDHHKLIFQFNHREKEKRKKDIQQMLLMSECKRVYGNFPLGIILIIADYLFSSAQFEILDCAYQLFSASRYRFDALHIL